MPATRRQPIFLPALILLFLGLGWCGFWWLAASRLNDGVDNWIAREAQAGRIYACASRSVNGFPFRLEIDCVNPQAELPSDTGPIRMAAKRFLAVAQVYDPTHIIGEFRGPLTITYSDAPKLTASWTFAGASLLGSTEAIESVSLIVDDLDMRSGEEGNIVATAKKLKADARPTPEVDSGSYDMVTLLDSATVPALDALLGSSAPTGIELQARICGLEDLKPRPMSERLKAFAAAGGNLRIALAKITRSDIALESRGDIKLDAQGRPEGQLSVAIRGIDNLTRLAPSLGDLGPLAGAGLNLLGQKTTLEGANARRFDVTLKDGIVRLSGIPVAQVPPLY